MARIRQGTGSDEDLPEVSVLVGRRPPSKSSQSPAKKQTPNKAYATRTSTANESRQHSQILDEPSKFVHGPVSSVVRVSAKDQGVRRQRPLTHISGNSLLAPLTSSDKVLLGKRADIRNAESGISTVRRTPRRRVEHVQLDPVGNEYEQTIVEEAASSPIDATWGDKNFETDESEDGTVFDDVWRPKGIQDRHHPRSIANSRRKGRQRASVSPSPSSPSPQRTTPELAPGSQTSSEIIDLTSSPSPRKALPVFHSLPGLLLDSRPSSSDNDRKAILTFDPPAKCLPHKAPPRPVTPTETTPPPSPSKGKLLSPSKKAQRIADAPLRPSIDAFWSATVVNDWNDQYSPKKECLTSPRKKRFQDMLNRLDSTTLDDPGYESPTASPRKSPTKKNAAAAKRRKEFEACKHVIASDFLAEVDARISGGQIAELAASTGGVKLIWSKKLNSTAGRANWRRETIKKTAADGTKTITYRHECSIELADKVIDDEERLINVVAHEFCHLANFMISGVKDRPHGKEFKEWAAKVSRAFGDRGVEVTTKHSYIIDYKYVWECEACGLEFKRHSKSINPKRHSCGSCKARLVQTKPVPRSNGATAGGYAGFVKEHFARLRRENPGVAHGAVMELIGRLYKEQKAAAAAAAAAATIITIDSPELPVSTESSPDVDDLTYALNVVILDD